MAEAMVNQFGNYLCQKVIEAADPMTLSQIVNTLLHSLVTISLNVHGTRAI